MKNGKLYVITAPSGAGKTSLLKAVRERLPELKMSISHTTRAPRPGEVDGKDYFFVSVQEFEQMMASDRFLEFAKVFDHYYGTSRDTVQNLLNSGEKVLLEIDWQGARIVRQKMDDLVSIFILPPSVKELERRLRARAQDSEQVIQRRMRDAATDIGHWKEFDYLILNDDFERAVENLISIFQNPADYQSVDSTVLSQLESAIAGYGS